MADFVETRGDFSKRQTLVPQQAMVITLEPRAGELSISVLSRILRPTPGKDDVKGKPGSDPDDRDFDDFVIEGLETRVVVKPPTGVPRVHNLKSTDLDGKDGPTTITVTVPTELEKLPWRMTVTNVSPVEASVRVFGSFVASRHLLRTTEIPISLLNGAAQQLIKGLAPEIRVDGTIPSSTSPTISNRSPTADSSELSFRFRRCSRTSICGR
jgi:hypothetical protein